MAAAHPSECEDRISEVYYGELFSETRSRRARDRIHWMCKSVRGSKVLDVGCSQGIVAILLAREGHTVVGIDTSAGAIEFAKRDVAKETKEVQARVQFLNVDLFSLNDVADFDTVVLGEVVEHQTDPAAFFRRALIPLRANGRVVLTTPFGYSPHDDHKSSMFLSWLTQLSELSIRVDTCEIVGGYIRLVISKLPAGQPSSLPNPAKLLRKTESGTLNSQRRLHAMINQRQQEIEQLEQARQSFEEDRAQFETELAGAKTRESTLSIFAASFKKTQSELVASQRELAVLRNSASFAVGYQLVLAFRRPYRLPLLPLLMLRAARRALAARRKPPAGISHHLTRNPTVVVFGTDPVVFHQNTTPDQDHELSIDIVGEPTPCRKGVLLEFFMGGSDELQGFLRLNPQFRKRAASGTAFMYLDLDGTASQRTGTIVRTGMTCKVVRFSLTRFRGTAPITAVVHPMRTLTPVEALERKRSGGSTDARSLAGQKLLKALSILDDFTEHCLEPEAELVPVSQSQWRQEVDYSKPALLFVESAWRGNGGEWNYALTKPQKHGQELKKLVAYCSANRIPTLFWNKEDPVNFDTFIEVASWFDYVFTTDAASVEKYRRILGRDCAFALPFAAQPAIHNPIRLGETIPRIAFTGSWRGTKYPARAQWIETLLTPLAQANLLDIFDRYAGMTDDTDLIFPPSLQPAVKGALPYKDLVEQVYKRYAAFVNVNSVDTSETMLARRVFEILACGAPVISSPSPAIEKTFGDVVLTPSSQKEALAMGTRLLDDFVFRESLASRGVRLVHSSHTYAHRMEEVCHRIGLPYIAKKPKLVSVICVSQRPAFLPHVQSQLSRQNHKDMELIFVRNSPAFSEEEIAARFSAFKLKLLNIPEDQILADGLNAALKVANGDYLAKIDDDDYYGPNYLSDALLAFDYVPAVGLVGKKSFFAYLEATNQTVLRFPGHAYTFCRQVHGATLLWDRRKLDGLEFERVRRGTDTRFLERARDLGVKIFSTDPFNFVHVRYADKARHTWAIDDEEFASKAVKIETGLCERLLDT